VDGKLVLKTQSGEDVVVTESLLNAVSGALQDEINNLSGDFLGLTDTPSTYSGSDTNVLTVSGCQIVFTPQSEIIPTLTEAQLSGALDDRYVNVAGDTMTGPLDIQYTGIQPLNIAQGTTDSQINLKVGHSSNQLAIGQNFGGGSPSAMYINAIGSGATLELRRGNTTRLEFTGPNAIFGTSTAKVEIQSSTESTTTANGALVVPNGGKYNRDSRNTYSRR
jgi:hypothetical protein